MWTQRLVLVMVLGLVPGLGPVASGAGSPLDAAATSAMASAQDQLSRVQAPTQLAVSPVPRWTRQFGGGADDVATEVVVGDVGVYVAGTTHDYMAGGLPEYGWIRRYDTNGDLEWTRTVRVLEETAIAAAAVYRSSVYVVGTTSVPPQVDYAFVRKYDTEGNLLWTQQFGRTFHWPIPTSVTVNGTGVYVGGMIGTPDGQDVFVRRYDGAGNLQWERQFGMGDDNAGGGVAVYGTRVYVAGSSMKVWYEYHPFVRCYDASGDIVWSRQVRAFGFAFGVAANQTGVYIVGEGVLRGTTSGGADAFIRAFGLDGTTRWTRQIGSPFDDSALTVSVNRAEVFVAGNISGPLHSPNERDSDVFVHAYGVDGAHHWGRQWGTAGWDVLASVASDAVSVYVAGDTTGSMHRPNAGWSDAFIRKFA